MFVCADIGEAVTEIVLVSEVNNKYYYLYNITLYNLSDKEQFKIFKYIGEKTSANLIGLDVTDGMGRAIYRSLEEVFPKENLCWVGFNEKIRVEIEKDDKGNIILKDGKPVWKEEYVDSWSVKRLRDLLYEEGRFELPLDYKFDSQLNQVIATQSGNRTLYTCFTEDTNILTDRGWLKIDQVKNNDLVASLDIKNNKVYYKGIKNIISQDYSGDLVNYDSKTFKFLVTKDHNMLIVKPHNYKRNKPNKFEFVKAENLYGGMKIKRDFGSFTGKKLDKFVFKNYCFNNKKQYKEVDIIDWLKFLGWFVSEGCIKKEAIHSPSIYTVSITQTNVHSENRKEIESIIKRLNLKGCWNGKEYVFSNKYIWNWLKENCYLDCNVYNSHYKKIPDFIRDLNPILINYFLETYFRGDGSRNEKFNNKYGSSISASKKLSCDIQELLLKIGVLSTINTIKGSSFNKEGIYYKVCVNHMIDSSVIKKNNLSKIFYKGKVFCVETEPFHNIYVMYKGKSFWCGNCISSEDHLFAAFRVFGITEWTNYLTIVKNIKKKKFFKSGV
jgi:hypothetical protein